jgi:hypothetical protein
LASSSTEGKNLAYPAFDLILVLVIIPFLVIVLLPAVTITPLVTFLYTLTVSPKTILIARKAQGSNPRCLLGEQHNRLGLDRQPRWI